MVRRAESTLRRVTRVFDPAAKQFVDLEQTAGHVPAVFRFGSPPPAHKLRETVRRPMCADPVRSVLKPRKPPLIEVRPAKESG
jgi:hypothetical protein